MLKWAGLWHLDFSALQTQTEEKGDWLLLPASLKLIVKKLSLKRQLDKNGKTVLRTLQKHPQLWETFLPLGACQQIDEKMTGVVKHLFSWLYRRWDCTDVNHFRYEMSKKTFLVNYPLSCYEGRGRGCWSDCGYSLQIFEDAHGPCNLSMSSLEDSKQCQHKW